MSRIREIHFLVGLDDLSKYKVESFLDVLIKSYSKFTCNLIHKLVLCFPDDYEVPEKYNSHNIFKFKYKNKTASRYDNMYYTVEYLEEINSEEISIMILEPDMVFYRDHYIFNKNFLSKIHIYYSKLESEDITPDKTLSLQFNISGYDTNSNIYVFSGAYFPSKYKNILKDVFKKNEEFNLNYELEFDLTYIAFFELIFNDYLTDENSSKAEYIIYDKERDVINDETLFIHCKDINILRSLSC